MQRFQLISAFAVCLFVITTVGCGGSGSNEVVQPAANTGMSEADQQSYEEAMKQQMQQQRR